MASQRHIFIFSPDIVKQFNSHSCSYALSLFIKEKSFTVDVIKEKMQRRKVSFSRSFNKFATGLDRMYLIPVDELL